MAFRMRGWRQHWQVFVNFPEVGSSLTTRVNHNEDYAQCN
jgi:hypothetical protein